MMTTPTRTYNAFDVVLVPFPFIDSSHSKKRPALILSSSIHFNSQVGASVMTMITSKTHTPWPLDYEIIDLQAAGLPVKSIVRMKFFTLDHRLILKRVGQLALNDQQAISDSLRTLFSL